MNNVGIVGLGGSGGYILDIVAKATITEIHLFDGDRFQQHSAFRAPGAARLETLESSPFKVDYFAEMYGVMRRGLTPHACDITEETIHLLRQMDFVFVAVDQPAVRRLICEYLREHGIPFIDVGIDVQRVEGTETLFGTCRATLCTAEKSEHFDQFVSQTGEAPVGVYDDNIQVVDLNAMVALLAVIKWKKFCGFYQDLFYEYHTVYSTNLHALTRGVANDDPEDDKEEPAA